MNRVLSIFFIMIASVTAVNAQYQKGQWALGGEFSFINSRNNISRSTNAFSDNLSTGFNISAIGGKFVTQKMLLYGIVDVAYNSSGTDLLLDDITGKREQRSYISITTAQIGIGIRRYYAVNERNIVGFFVQGQLRVGNNWTSIRYFSSEGDSVFTDVKQKYPIRIANFNINPGIYINVTPMWQLTLNVGNLYATQTIVPSWVDVGGISKRNFSFGLDVNLFDFRLGAVYTPNRRKE